MVIIEWLRRIDDRLVKFVQEKFATDLSRNSSSLITLVETLARNMNTYLSELNRTSGAVQSVTDFTKPPGVAVATEDEYYQQHEFQNFAGDVNFARRGAFRQNNRSRGEKSGCNSIKLLILSRPSDRKLV